MGRKSTVLMMLQNAIFLLAFSTTAYAAQRQIGTSTFDYYELWAVNCYNDDKGIKTSELWRYNDPGRQSLQSPDRKTYLSGSDTVQWEGSPVQFNDPDGTGYTINLVPNAHDMTNDGSLVGGLDVGGAPHTFPCYSYRSDLVDFWNGWKCYRLYRCNSVPHIVTDIAFGPDTVNVYNSFYTDRIRDANLQRTNEAPRMQEIHDGYDNTVTFVVEATGYEDQSAIVRGITDNAGQLGASFAEMFWRNIIAERPDNIPNSVAMNFYEGPDFREAAVRYAIYPTSSRPPPEAGCPQTLGTAGAALGILAGVIGVATGGAATAVAAAGTVAAGAVSAVGGGLSIVQAFQC